MNKIYYILLFILISKCIAVAAPISMDEFKKLSIPERQKVIQNSPSEVKGDLMRVNRKLLLRQKYGGDEGLRQHQEDRALQTRGIEYLLGIFLTERQLLAARDGQVMRENREVGMAEAAQIKAAKAFLERKEALERRYWKTVRPLLLATAATPDAIALEKEAKNLFLDWEKRFPGGQGTITEQNLQAIHKTTQEILDRLKQLPHLTPEQVQAEIDALPEEELHR